MEKPFHSFPGKPGVQSSELQEFRWKALGLGKQWPLKGKWVLDVGAANGWFSHKCIDGGAKKVVAIEPVRLVHTYEHEGQLEVIEDFFDTAVPEYLPRCMFGTDYDKEFDYVLMLRVLYHMKNPVLALQRAHDALRPGGILFLESWFDNPTSDDMTMKLIEDAPDGWRFAPSRACLYRLLELLGFEDTCYATSYMECHRNIWQFRKKITV